MRGLGPRICHLHALSAIVIPAKAEIQLRLSIARKLDPDIRRGDE
jgi:hypothetical protein